MYGTLASVKTAPGKSDDLRALADRIGLAPGQLGHYVFQMDADPTELWLVALFADQAAYQANAQTPEQHQRYLEMRALLQADPSWHDGEVIDVAVAGEQNQAIVRTFYDQVINQENKVVIDELFAPDVLIHDPFMGTQQGAAAFAQLLGMFDTAFPHHRVTVDEIISQGELVCVLHTHFAVHTGPFMGMPATGKSAQVSGMELFRMRDGKIVEFWRKDDDVSLLMQLGMLPMPA